MFLMLQSEMYATSPIASSVLPSYFICHKLQRHALYRQIHGQQLEPTYRMKHRISRSWAFHPFSKYVLDPAIYFRFISRL